MTEPKYKLGDTVYFLFTYKSILSGEICKGEVVGILWQESSERFDICVSQGGHSQLEWTSEDRFFTNVKALIKSLENGKLGLDF